MMILKVKKYFCAEIIFMIILLICEISAWERGDRFKNYFDTNNNTTLNILPEYKVERYVFPKILPNSVDEIKNPEDDGTMLYRIPSGPKSPGSDGKRPALIQHAILCTDNDDCTINKPQIAVAYLLVDQGYDTWLGVSNGSIAENTISNEIIEKDKLEMIAQYILMATDQSELLVMGYFNGTVQFFSISARQSQQTKQSKISKWFEKIPGVKNVKNWYNDIYYSGRSYFTRSYNKVVQSFDNLGKKLDFIIDNKPVENLKSRVLRAWGIMYSMVVPTFNVNDLSRMINHPDVHLDAPQMIKKYGYNVETHEVKTDDGYILSLHRITGRNNSPPDLKKPVVFLQHGILASSAIWVLTGPSKGLGYILADKGYDVWMGNSRGNTYSQAHEKLSTKDAKFWDFSWHEMGIYDLPASIDYVLSVTGHEKLYYLAHSQGTTSFFVMMSERPEYNDKIIKFAAYAPIVYVSHVQSPIVDFFSKISRPVYRTLQLLKIYNFLPTNALLTKIGRDSCEAQTLYQVVCSNTLFMITGYDSAQINKTVVPIILGHLPAGSSIKQFFHYGQLVNSKKFQAFNYNDPQKNMEIYGQLQPPEYKLNNTKIPTALFYGSNDLLSDPQDVEQLAHELPNLKITYKVPMEYFNHIDFMFAIDAPALLYQPTIEYFEDSNEDINQSNETI